MDGVEARADGELAERLAAEDWQTRFPIVAIGASAGGLAALETVIGGLTPGSGTAYVVLQHLSPDFESHMTTLLSRVTSMAVLQPKDGAELEPDHIYVMPPKKEMILSGGRLLLTDKDPRNAPSLPIDTFLRSLAQEAGALSVAVILSGTGSDGARGVRAIKDVDGHVIVQDPEDAEFDGMPHTSIATGAADTIARAAEIPEQIRRAVAERMSAAGGGALPAEIDDAIQRVVQVLDAHYDIDFSCYKETTLVRRIQRRIDMVGAGSADAYVALLAVDAEERKRMYQDLLIGVTDFFRDPESYAALAEAIRASMFNEGSTEARVWVAGCATGEEVYSIAMLLDEIRTERNWSGRIRLFATDIQHEALKKASAAVYSEEAVAHIPRDRLEKYFVHDDTRYRVAERLREMVIFATHNLVADAPFTQLDLVCCRNVLIYLQPPTQARVLGLFHFGLRTRGLLFLGPSETLGKLEDEFEPISRDGKIYAKRRDLRLISHANLSKLEARQRRGRNERVPVADTPAPDLYEVLLDRYMPTAFLLNERFQIVHCFHGAEKLLAIRSGRMSTTLTGLLEGRLRTAVSGLLDRFKQERGGIHSVNLRSAESEGGKHYTITVSPVEVKRSNVSNVLVEIRSVESEQTLAGTPAADATVVAAEYVESLERDLEFARGELQSTVEELEAANEELQAANEELIASNEELQSTNEELRSVNEELNNVNTDHQEKISDLIEVTDDLENLLHTINVGVLFLDASLCIRRANRRVGELLHILPQDVGRSFAHFKNNLDAPEAFETVRRVLETGQAAEHETRTTSGTLLLWTVMPYSSRMGMQGVVLTIIDITSRRAAESEARRLSAIVRTARDAIISHSLDGRILSWNSGAERLFGYSEQEAVGNSLRLIVPDDLADETEQILAATKAGKDVAPFETTRLAKDGAHLHVLLSVAPIKSETGSVSGASVIAIDITARKSAEERAAIAIEQREKFLALLSHELRNPLMAISSANEVLAISKGISDVARGAQQVISRQVKQMSRLLEDTLDASRMRHDKIELQRKRLDLRSALEAALDATRPRADRESIKLDVALPNEPVFVRADATRLQQVIVNLAQNAINHSKAGDTITISLSVDGEDAVVLVADEGIGIAPESLPQLFEPFFQASRRSRAGLGLGLSLARSIARAHGGDIVAASGGVGHGARFEVRLPIIDEGAETGVDLAAPRNGRAGTPTVVLVDDDTEGRQSLGVLLQNAGYEVLEAGDGTSGLQLIEKAQPSVAVLDIGLPDISGLEVARRVRRNFGPNQVRLIALTGFGRQNDREAAVEAGCDMHLVKPIDFATLERVIAYQVSR